jgi:FixJ family two-component response regulator
MLNCPMAADWIQHQLDNEHPPVIFITALRDIRAPARAIKNGTVNFLTKRLNEADPMFGLSSD